MPRPPRAGVTRRRPCRPLGQDDALFFHGLFHRPELIPEHGGALEVELIGSLQHGPAQLFEQLARTPRKQEFHALDQRLVGRLGHVLRAWREALADVVVQAGADPVLNALSVQRRKGKARWMDRQVSRAARPEVKGPK